MSEKTVVLMNLDDGVSRLFGDTKQTKIKIGTWSDEQQQKFIESLYKFEDKDTYRCLCSFDVEYDNTRLCDIGIGDGVGCTINDWPDHLKTAKDSELVIEMDPSIKRPGSSLPDDGSDCECGAKHSHCCPRYIKDGKCTSPSIRKLVGEVLFPEKYGKTR